MECQGGRELAKAYAMAARQYADAVAGLGRLTTPTLDPTQIIKGEEETLRLAGECLRQAEKARMALESHIELHRCAGDVTKG